MAWSYSRENPNRPYVALTEAGIRLRVAEAIAEGASYARAHTVSPCTLTFYRYTSGSPSGRQSVGVQVPNTAANERIVDEMLSTESPGSARR